MLRAGLSLRAGGASAAGAKLTVARAAGTSSIRVFSSRQQRPLVRKDSEIMLARSESIEAELAESQSGLSLMLVDQHARAIDEVVPWFLYNMPRAYFRQVPRELQEEHLRAFAAFKSSGAIPETTLRSPDGTLTFMREGSYPGMLQDMIHQVEVLHASASRRPLSSVSVFSSDDDTVALNVFRFVTEMPSHSNSIPEVLEKYASKLLAGEMQGDAAGVHASPSPIFQEESLRDFTMRCSPSFVAMSSPRRFCKQMEMVHDVTSRGTDEVAVDIEHNWSGTDDSMVTMAIMNVTTNSALKRVVSYLGANSLNISRVHVDVVQGETEDASCDDAPHISTL